jgi:RNA polymerase sigma-54 factor
MRLEPTPRPDHVLRVSARLITSSTILHLSSDELEHAVNQEQMENPALEVNESRVCLFCGTQLYGPTCTACGRFAQQVLNTSESSNNYEPLLYPQWDDQQRPYELSDIRAAYDSGLADSDDGDDSDPLASIPTGETLPEVLLQQLEVLVSPDDALIAEQLVGNLNERGYLEISIDEVANYLQVPPERVEYVLKQLQTLEPLGIGARNARECLLIQLEALSEQATPHPLAYTLIDRYLNRLGRGQFYEIARELKVSEQEVRQANLYIRNTLHPFPALIYQGDYLRSSIDAGFIRPDMIIRNTEMGFEVELIEEKRYHFRIITQHNKGSTNDELQRYMRYSGDQAKLFVDSVQRRWRTLKRVAEVVVHYQREFLEKGVRYLRPLTRAEVARMLSLDEGTVSRATANKYVLLPNGRLMPMSDFFDGSLSVKDVLRELITLEEPAHRLSDEELARLLTARGIPTARRTVTKYREEMGISSSRER